MCMELVTIKSKWHEFGTALGVPKYKLDEYEDKRCQLFKVIGYWHAGNVANKSITWKAIADTLRSIKQDDLATQIEDKYKCQ